MWWNRLEALPACLNLVLRFNPNAHPAVEKSLDPETQRSRILILTKKHNKRLEPVRRLASATLLVPTPWPGPGGIVQSDGS